MGRFRIAILGLTAALLASPVFAFEFPTLRQPTWQELSPQQKQILAPLASEWNQMDDTRRKKWMGIAGRYPHLKADEQARVQSQMRDWAQLTPQQKLRVREKYKAMRKAPPEKRATVREQWELYQQLPPEEKQRLQDEAARKQAEAQKQAREKARQATSVLSSKALKPGYVFVPAQQAPAPVTTVAPVPVPVPAPAPAASETPAQ